MRIRAKPRGVAAVELAIIAPVLFLAMLGMIEMGRAMQVQTALTNAVREGCRGFADSTATVTVGTQTYQTGTAAYAQYLVNDSLVNANIGISSGAATVTAVATSVTAGNIAMTKATVTATLPYSAVSYFPAFFLKGSLTATVSMQKS
jgi:Flp pilus assembly protein TadG